MKSPTYNNPAAISEPDVLGAVVDFAAMFGVPSMPDAPNTGRFFIGWGNRYALPSDNEYCVVTLINQRRRGTDVENYDAESVDENQDGILSMTEAINCDVQVDFVSNPNGNARRRAQSLETAARSSAGPRFFMDYDISCQYADDLRDLSGQDDTNQYVSRWSVTLHLGFTTGVTAELPWFDNVNLKNVENVNAHHHITKE